MVFRSLNSKQMPLTAALLSASNTPTYTETPTATAFLESEQQEEIEIYKNNSPNTAILRSGVESETAKGHSL